MPLQSSNGTCFTAGTQVVVGKEFDENDVFVQYVTMNIEDIQVGDWVYSYDTITGTLELKEVTAVFSLVSDHINYITIVDENGNTQVIETTDGHPFWVVTDEPDLERAAQGMIDENGAILHHNNIAPTENGFWVEAKDLREGDVFLGANGELSTVVSIERLEYPDGIAVYNLTVDGNHNYFVIAQCDEYGQTSVLVHNAGYGDNLPNVKAWFPGLASLAYHNPWGTSDFNSRILNMVVLRGIKPLHINMEYADKALSGSLAGTHQIWGPGQGPDYVGARGMLPCVGVVVYAPCGKRAAFHFSQGDSALATLMQYGWPPGSRAIIAGATDGNDTTVAQLSAILRFFNLRGITVEHFDLTHDIEGIYVDRLGNWIVVPTLIYRNFYHGIIL